MKKRSAYLGISYLLVVALVAIGYIYFTSENTVDVKIGKKYLHSYYWDEPNPFEDIKIDTVIILDIKKNYVKYKLLTTPESYPRSIEIKYFKYAVKSLDYKR